MTPSSVSNPNPASAPQHRRAVLGTVGLVLVALAIGGFLWWNASWQEPVQVTETSDYSKYLSQLSSASVQKLPLGFPRQYIFGTNPEVISGDITSSTLNNNVRYYAEVRAENTPKDLFAEYLEFFAKTNWNITEKHEGAGVSSISAEKGNRTMIVTFTPGTRSTIVGLSYFVPLK